MPTAFDARSTLSVRHICPVFGSRPLTDSLSCVTCCLAQEPLGTIEDAEASRERDDGRDVPEHSLQHAVCELRTRSQCTHNGVCKAKTRRQWLSALTLLSCPNLSQSMPSYALHISPSFPNPVFVLVPWSVELGSAKNCKQLRLKGIHTPHQQRVNDGRFTLPTELSSLCQPWGAPKRKSFCKLNRPACTHTYIDIGQHISIKTVGF